MYTELTTIDPSLASLVFSVIARAFICQKCQKIPLNPIQCGNINCEKMMCWNCHLGGNEKCFSCNQLIAKIAIKENQMKILNLIKFKCSKFNLGCTSIVEAKDYKIHTENCHVQNISNSNNLISLTNNNNLHINERSTRESDMAEYEKFSAMLNKKTSRPKTKAPTTNSDCFEIINGNELISKDKLMKSWTNEELQKLDTDFFSYPLKLRNISDKGTKDELIKRYLEYKGITRNEAFQDGNLKTMIKDGTIDVLTVEELSEVLGARGLKKSGNKDEKVQNLSKYLISKVK